MKWHIEQLIFVFPHKYLPSKSIESSVILNLVCSLATAVGFFSGLKGHQVCSLTSLFLMHLLVAYCAFVEGMGLIFSVGFGNID